MMECQPSFILITVKSCHLPCWFLIFAIYSYFEIKSLEEKLVISLFSGIKELGVRVRGVEKEIYLSYYFATTERP